MHYYGWARLVWLPLPLIGAVVVGLILVRRDPLLRRPPPAATAAAVGAAASREPDEV
jgi:hypothetical protein